MSQFFMSSKLSQFSLETFHDEKMKNELILFNFTKKKKPSMWKGLEPLLPASREIGPWN